MCVRPVRPLCRAAVDRSVNSPPKGHHCCSAGGLRWPVRGGFIRPPVAEQRWTSHQRRTTARSAIRPIAQLQSSIYSRLRAEWRSSPVQKKEVTLFEVVAESSRTSSIHSRFLLIPATERPAPSGTVEHNPVRIGRDDGQTLPRNAAALLRYSTALRSPC